MSCSHDEVTLYAINTMWTMFHTIAIFSEWNAIVQETKPVLADASQPAAVMQAGFAMLETGFIPHSFGRNILFKVHRVLTLCDALCA
jgi:hypothetical protein